MFVHYTLKRQLPNPWGKHFWVVKLSWGLFSFLEDLHISQKGRQRIYKYKFSKVNALRKGRWEISFFFYALERLKKKFFFVFVFYFKNSYSLWVNAIKMLLHWWRYLYTPHLFFLLDCGRKCVLCICAVASDVSQVHYWRLIKIDWIISIPV